MRLRSATEKYSRAPDAARPSLSAGAGPAGEDEGPDLDDDEDEGGDEEEAEDGGEDDDGGGGDGD